MNPIALLISHCSRWPWLFLSACLALASPAWAGGAAALGTILNPDGTLQAGAHGSFNAQGYEVGMAPDGRPSFRPLDARRLRGTRGAGDAGWSDAFGMNGINGDVYALAVVGNTVYAGGLFTTASGVAATNVAKWDGTVWAPLGAGIGTVFTDYVYALALDASGNLYAGGSFTRAGGVPANRVAKWNGTTWSALGVGVLGSVYALVVDSNGNLYAGGNVSGGTFAVTSVMKWNGSSWTGTNGGFDGVVHALVADSNGNVYAGGTFSQAGSVTANRVAKWNGTAWSALGTGLGTTASGVVFTLAFDQRSGSLYAGGTFSIIGSVVASRIARWNGTAWSALGAGLSTVNANALVNAMAVDGNGRLYVSGIFGTAGLVPANSVAQWDGTTWSALGAGFDGPVLTLRPTTSIPVYGYAMAVDSGGNLYAGGNFVLVDGAVIHNVAKWTPGAASWSRLGSLVAAGGSDIKNQISALALASNGDLYAGGSFAAIGDVAATNIAKWNGTTWQPLGTGLGFAVNSSNIVSDLALDGLGNLYAGGVFFSAGGVPVNRVAKWDGTAWSALGSGLSGSVSSLVVDSNNNLYVGGIFTQAGGVTVANIARWDGAVWSAVGVGTTSIGVVGDLALDGSG